MMTDLTEILTNPKDIVKTLDLSIIGQERVKKDLAILLTARALNQLSAHGVISRETKPNKHNLLLIGPTGCGKTSLIKAISDISDMPITMADASSLTASGYYGANVEDILIDHVNNCKEWLIENYGRLIEVGAIPAGSAVTDILQEIAECGIIFIDEIDKARRRKVDDGDINGDMVQNELLKFLGEGIIHVGGNRKNGPSCDLTTIDTSNITFICAGAFTGLEEIISNRLNKQSGIGFHADLSHKNSKALLQDVTTEDLVEYGFKPEFLGRIATTSVLNPLSIEALEKVLLEPDNAIFKQYKDTFYGLGYKLTIEKAAVRLIAEAAHKHKTGARALQSILVPIISEFLYNIFDIKGTKLVITKELVLRRLERSV